jgi:hypothetical protein
MRAHRSERVHSQYECTVCDLPWRGLSVTLEVRSRRFFCANKECERSIFCERLPEIAAHARKTERLEEALTMIAFELGGEAGARLARELGLPTSPDALLERIRITLPEPLYLPQIMVAYLRFWWKYERPEPEQRCGRRSPEPASTTATAKPSTTSWDACERAYQPDAPGKRLSKPKPKPGGGRPALLPGSLRGAPTSSLRRIGSTCGYSQRP